MSVISNHIGQIGKIVSEKNFGHLIQIEDDTKNSGGYLILGWTEDHKNGFDYWVEKTEHLDAFFSEAGWKIEWPE